MGARDGRFPLVVTAITVEARDIVSLTLADPVGAPLPPWEPGAHLDLQLITRQERQYSLCGDPVDTSTYRVAVLREELSRGGSMYVHEFLRVGSRVHARPPRNLFPLVEAREHVLLAAGIGITALLPRARALEAAGATWSLDFAARGEAFVPFRDELAQLGARIHSPDHGGRLDLDALLAEPRPGAVVSACGPARFLTGVTAAMTAWPAGSLQLERFEPRRVPPRSNRPFTVHCLGSDVSVEVPADRSMHQALRERGLRVEGSCLRGVCGSCAVRVLDGAVEHRDSLTSGSETDVMYPCVSRAAGDALTVDV